MHEATIARSILSIAANRLRQAPNAQAVLSLTVAIGEFRNVEVDCLQFAFDNLKGLYQGCEDCGLTIQLVPAKAVCSAGAHVYHPRVERGFRCGECDGRLDSLVCGQELNVVGTRLQLAVEKETSHARIA